MPDDARWQEPAGPSRSGRRVRRAAVFALVLAVAALLGRLGSDVDDGPAIEVESSSGRTAPPETVVSDPAAVSWRRLPDPGLAARDAHTAVWTGRAILVWGGYGPFGSGRGLQVDGVAYDPETGWLAIPPAPIRGLVNHTAVWTGAPQPGESPGGDAAGTPHPPGEMIVWSGGTSGERGAAYEPATQRWRVLSPDPLASRQFHAAVWTGPLGEQAGEMLVWGGSSPEGGGPSGAAYDPLADRWRALPDAPGGGSRVGFTASWTGEEMVVVGGTDERRGAAAVTAHAYDPVADTWRALPDPPGGPRQAHTAVWSGSELLVWGGLGPGGVPVEPAGVSYDPRADAWTALPHAPGGTRFAHAAVWAGDRMVIWGGGRSRGDRRAGLVYDPVERAWRALRAPIVPRVPARLVWTGEELVVLDGRSLSRALMYTPTW